MEEKVEEEGGKDAEEDSRTVTFIDEEYRV